MSGVDISAIFARNPPGLTAVLQRKRVGIAGCGGLGSNAAVSLARAGIGRIVLVDGDVVDASNLNRQHYFQQDIGTPKVEALSAHLRAINPGIEITAHYIDLIPEGVAPLLGGVDLLIEALDDAGSKRWLIDAWCRLNPGRPLVGGNGVSGYGRTELAITHAGNVHFCGDGRTDPDAGLCSARVALVANMQANLAIQLLMGEVEA